jgi:Holliday junction resolvasome RuvABC endonuclease subunit
MNVLVLDPATSSGYMIVSLEGDLRLIDWGLIDLKGNEVGDKLSKYYSYIQEVIEAHQISVIVFEEYFFSSRFCTGANLNVYIRGVLVLLASQKNLKVWTIPPSEWKKTIAGTSSPTKEQKKKYGKLKAKKEYIKQALLDRWNITFPDKVENSKGRFINLKSDLIDCVGIGISYLLRESKYQIQASLFDYNQIKINVKELKGN